MSQVLFHLSGTPAYLELPGLSRIIRYHKQIGYHKQIRNHKQIRLSQNNKFHDNSIIFFMAGIFTQTQICSPLYLAIQFTIDSPCFGWLSFFLKQLKVGSKSKCADSKGWLEIMPSGFPVALQQIITSQNIVWAFIVTLMSRALQETSKSLIISSKLSHNFSLLNVDFFTNTNFLKQSI